MVVYMGHYLPGRARVYQSILIGRPRGAVKGRRQIAGGEGVAGKG